MRTTLHNLQGLRGIACLLVLGIHLGGWESQFGIAREFLRPFLWFGYGGVDLFFVISGFIIAYSQADSFGKPRAIPGYLFRRFWRVYPLFWIMMLIAVPLTNFAFFGAMNTYWLSWLTLTPAPDANYYIGPAWTMMYEVIFYAVFGLFLLVPRRMAPLALIAWAILIGVAQLFKNDDSFHAATIGEALVSPLIWEFLLGCGVAYVIRNSTPRWGRCTIFTGLIWVTVGIVAMATPGQPYALCTKLLLRTLIFGPSSALIVYGVIAAERQGTLRLPRWLQATGDASYSIYLWHGPIGLAIHFNILEWPHSTTPHLAWIAFMLLACWGGGMLFHRWVERPLLNWIQRKPKPPEPVIFQKRVSMDGESARSVLVDSFHHER